MKKENFTRIISLIIVVVMLLSMVSCNSPKTPETDNGEKPEEPNDEHVCEFGEWKVILPSTCTTSGYKLCKCVCGENQIMEIEATGHTEVTVDATDSSCTMTGLSEGKICSLCGTVIVAQEVIPVKSHTEVIDNAIAATCTQTGLTEGKHCSACDTVIVAQSETPIVAHTYTDKYDESCNDCGYIREAECAHANTVNIPGKAATCTSAGLTSGKKCSECGEILVKQMVIPANGHSEVVDEKKEATCTSTGLTEGKHCSVCNTVIVVQAIIPMKAHTNGEWIIDKNSTCTESGIKHIECISCKTILSTATIDMKEHTEVIDPAVPATPTETGLTEGKHCSVCNKVLIEQKIVEKVSISTEANFTLYTQPNTTSDYAEWEGSSMDATATTSEIKWMQAALNYCIKYKGLKATILSVDGRFGPASKETTLAFQKAYGLTADGSFGPNTIKKMLTVIPKLEVETGFVQKNILQSNAASSSKYLSGEWYKLSNGNCSCCEGKYSSEYGEHEYIQGGGCAIVSLVSAIYNLGGTISDSEVYATIDAVFDWSYQKGYWANGLKSNNFFTSSDEKFGDLYGYSISSTYSATATDTRLKEHIQNGGTAVVHVYGHYMVIVDYRVQDGVEQFKVFDPAPGSGTYWNSSNRRNITSASGDWFSIADLKNDGDDGTKGNKGSKENIEIDKFWLVFAK